MKNVERITERLRQGFASIDDAERAADGSCPSAERIWDGAHGELSPEEAKQVALHLAECPSCAADWRLAMHSTERVASTEPAIVPTRPRWRSAVVGAAAAALVFVGLIAVFRGTDVFQPTETTYRSPDDEVIRSLVPDGAVLSRDEAMLRWTPVGTDARYSVEVGRPDLSPLASVYDLKETEYRIPLAALETVEPGGIVVWQVEAGLPDGRRVVSEAFLAKIE